MAEGQSADIVAHFTEIEEDDSWCYPNSDERFAFGAAFSERLSSCGLASTMSACRLAAGFPGHMRRPMKKSSFMSSKGRLMFGLMDISGI